MSDFSLPALTHVSYYCCVSTAVYPSVPTCKGKVSRVCLTFSTFSQMYSLFNCSQTGGLISWMYFKKSNVHIQKCVLVLGKTIEIQEQKEFHTRYCCSQKWIHWIHENKHNFSHGQISWISSGFGFKAHLGPVGVIKETKVLMKENLYFLTPSLLPSFTSCFHSFIR